MTKQPGFIRTITSLLKIIRGKPRIPASLADNTLLKVIYNRRSIRSFSAEPISSDVFDAILEAGRLAPSTVNLQTWTFAAFDKAEWLKIFGHSIPFHGSHAIIVISDSSRYRKFMLDFPDCPLTEYTIGVINASLAAMAMNLAAEALGVSSVMLSETGRSGLLDAKYLIDTLHLPAGAVPLMTIVFGFSRGPYPPMPPKLPIDQIVCHGQYQPADPVVMQGWMEQMIAGYNVSHLGSSFQNQLNVYQSKIGRAETNLHDIIFSRERTSRS